MKNDILVKKGLNERLRTEEKIPSVIKRCPKCNHLTLEYNPDTGEIRCTNCGFKENLMMTR
jgi:ribosomal protein S27E